MLLFDIATGSFISVLISVCLQSDTPVVSVCILIDVPTDSECFLLLQHQLVGWFCHMLLLIFVFVKVKLKCPLVQALRLCTGCKAHRGSRGIALPFHDHGTRRG